tara:strand:- start:356 stop:1675 length:1320 start_codon:yes stop_codon:yes gene_type:complete
MQKRQAKNHKQFAKYGFANIGVPTQPVDTKDVRKLKDEYIPFGDNNLFPQELSELKRMSSTHRAILSQKTTFASQGYIIDNEKLYDFCKSCNADDEQLKDVKHKVLDDFFTFGNGYIELVKFEGGINCYHIDATNVRLHKNGKDVIIHPDWLQYRRRKSEAVILPLFPEFTGERCVIHIKDYEPTFQYYGLPDYIAGLEHLSIDFEIGKWNNTKFKNNFQPSAIVEITADMGDAEAEELVRLAQEKFTNEGGAENNGKILFIVKNGDTSPANVTLIKDDNDASFKELQFLTDQNLITAHRWQPSLMGIVSGGKMNSTGSEIRISYEVVLATVVRSVSEKFDSVMRKCLIEYLGIDKDELVAKFEPPISYLSDLDVKQVLTINEQRAILGFDEVEGGDGFLKDSGTEVVEEIDEEIGENEKQDEDEEEVLIEDEEQENEY